MSSTVKFFWLCALALFLTACSIGKVDSFKTITNGEYKIVIRSEEPLHSGIHNIDICVLAVADSKFPPRYKKAQCFFQGYDLDGLAVKWLAPRYIHIDVKDGWVSEFRNSATVSLKGTPGAVGFHISLYDRSSYPRDSAPSNVVSSSPPAAQRSPRG